MPKHEFDGVGICTWCGRCDDPKCPSGVCREWREKCWEEDQEIEDNQ